MNIAPKPSNQPSVLQTLQTLRSKPHLEITKGCLTGFETFRSYISDERFQNLYILMYGDRPNKIQAAKRLAQLMRTPRLDRVTKATANSRAKKLGIPVEQYFREAIYPDALLHAASKIVLPQMAPRLGRHKWVVNDAGKSAITTVHDVHDDEAFHWLYQEAAKICRAIVMEQPYSNKDALDMVIDGADGSFAERALIAESLQELNRLKMHSLRPSHAMRPNGSFIVYYSTYQLRIAPYLLKPRTAAGI